ncbi:MAG: hypothetical protein JXL97_18555 [Bacteroidales bacterium]|nr:hypothetical protein [Bacteroidales bacterium]
MRKLIYILLFLVISINLNSQEIKIPEPVYMDDFFDYKNSSYTMIDVFMPIGWSENGKFAYLMIESYVDLRGEGFLVDFCVFNAVTDKYVYAEIFDTYIFVDDGVQCEDEQIICAWKYLNFDSVLVSNNIHCKDSIELIKFPLNLNNEIFNYKINSNKLIINSSLKGDKTVTNNLNDNEILSAIKSPYEDRILIVAFKSEWEKGPESPDEFYYRIVFSFFGCNLDIGFY